MSFVNRYKEFQKLKGRMPKSMEEPMYKGGMVDEDDMGVSEDEEWNEHDDDSSGEPPQFDTAYGKHDDYSKGYAFGGEIKAPMHGDEGHPEMPEEELHAALAQAIKRRKQAKPGRG